MTSRGPGGAWRGCWLSLVAAMMWLASVGLSSAWEVRRVGGQEYVSLREMARFYEMSRPKAIDRDSWRSESTTRSLTVRAKGRGAIINGVSHWLSFPVLASGGDVLISRIDLSKTIEPLLRPNKVTTRQRVRTVVLDAGHGGHDSGARSRYTPAEKVLTLDMVKRMKLVLERMGFKVVLTRSRDVFIPLEQRAHRAAAFKDAIFVSVHYNSAPNSAAKGVESFALAPRGSPVTDATRMSVRMSDYVTNTGNSQDPLNVLLAHAIQRRMVELRKTADEDRGVKRARWAVLRRNVLPAVLIELGFLTSPHDARLLNDITFRDRLASKISEGIADFRTYIEGDTTSPSIESSLLVRNFVPAKRQTPMLEEMLDVSYYKEPVSRFDLSLVSTNGPALDGGKSLRPGGLRPGSGPSLAAEQPEEPPAHHDEPFGPPAPGEALDGASDAYLVAEGSNGHEPWMDPHMDELGTNGGTHHMIEGEHEVDHPDPDLMGPLDTNVHEMIAEDAQLPSTNR